MKDAGLTALKNSDLLLFTELVAHEEQQEKNFLPPC